MNMLNVIDFEKANAESFFVESIRLTGFAVFENHPLMMSDISELYASWLRFFNSPDEEKNQYSYCHGDLSGYISSSVSEQAKGYDYKDLKELFHYYKGKAIPEEQRDCSDTMMHKVKGLSALLLTWLHDALPPDLSKKRPSLPSMIERSTRTLFRMNYYPPIDRIKNTKAPEAKRAEAHTDINLITLLPSASTAGLQIMQRGGLWLDIPYSKNYLIVNAGDMLSLYTDGYYPSVLHRVVVPENKQQERISLAVCVHPRDDVMLSAKYSAKSFLEERVKDLGLSQRLKD
jgi:isopenicillin N synthase-like dioxygenase